MHRLPPSRPHGTDSLQQDRAEDAILFGFVIVSSSVSVWVLIAQTA